MPRKHRGKSTMAAPTDATVFLTEKEVERIKTTVNTTLKKCSELSGKPREPPADPRAAIGEANSEAFMADMGGMGLGGQGRGDKLPAVAVGLVYPPSTAPLRDLQPMKLADLKMDTHHRGRRLTVKRVSLVVTHAARSWTVVQDEATKDTERLEMCLHKFRHGEEVLEAATMHKEKFGEEEEEPGSMFIIKEPYFTLNEQGIPTILVDHPSDMIVTDETQYHGQDGSDAAAAEKLATTCKSEGNTALKKQNLAQAHRSYTEGLKIARLPIVTKNSPGLARDICRNRALVNMLLNQHDEAKTDAKASLIGGKDQADKELDAKAYSRAGTAAYNLGEYEEAKSLFEEQLKLAPGDKIATANLKRIALRLSEQETGEYNMKKIRAGLSRDRPGADAATFVGSVEVKNSPGRGRGLFASADIPKGALIMAEKAFCVAWAHEDLALSAMTYDIRDDRIRVSPAGLTRAVVQRLLMNPSQMDRMYALHGDYQGDGKDIRATEDGPVVDVCRVHDIVSRNGFGLGSPYGAQGTSTGIWTYTAFVNHSCVSNAEKEFVGDLIVIRASRHIPAGQEILHSYIESADYDERQGVLMSTWGFTCGCELCKAEKADSVAVRRKRRELAGEADAFVAKEPCGNAKRLTVAKAQRLAKAIEETYDEKRFKGLPRVGANRIREWLAQAAPRR